MTQIPSIHFPRTIGDEKGYIFSDRIVTRMILSTNSLKELKVYCSFSSVSLAAWISHTKTSLTHLEIRVDDLSDKQPLNSSMCKIDQLASITNLQALRLWGVQLSERPHWTSFSSLFTLEIVGARLHDQALRGILNACPSLISLTLLGCSGIRYAAVDQMRGLKRCRLDFYGSGDCCIIISAPKLEFLEVQGASCIHVSGDHCLRHLSIANIQGL